MTLDATGGVLAGGTITVDGVTYVVPQNTIATLPSIAVAWGELFMSTGVNGTSNLPNGTANLPGGVSWQANVRLISRSCSGNFGQFLTYPIIRSLGMLLAINISLAWCTLRRIQLN
jgi:hypothetical protein